MNNKQMLETNKGKKHSPLQSIKRYCKYHCSCSDLKSWKDCALTNCYLYRYRLGKGNRASKPKHSSRAYNFTKKQPSTSEKQEKLI